MPDGIAAKPMFITATLSVIYFSVIIQGMLIRPLIRILKIEADNSGEYSPGIEEMQMEEEEQRSLKFEKMFDDFNKKYLFPVLIRFSGKH